MAKITDVAGNRVYAAERILGLYTEPIADVKTAQKMVDRLVATKRFQKAFPFYGTRKVTVLVGTGRGSYAWAHDPKVGGPSIRISELDTHTLWHELAHHLVFRHPHKHLAKERGHGPLFAAMLFKLVRIKMGAEAQQALRYSYRTWRVRMWNDVKQRKRLMSVPKQIDPRWVRYGKEASFAWIDEQELNTELANAYDELLYELMVAGDVTREQRHRLFQLYWRRVWRPRVAA